MQNSSPSRQEAAMEILRRRKLRTSFTDWCRECGYEPARHHRLLIEKLEALERGEIRRLLVTMPPGSAKSTYSSVLFPAWYLMRNRTGNVIAASHTTELAEKFGRRVRNLVAEHCQTLDIHLAEDSKAAGRWATKDGAEYYAAGCGVGIAGFRADLAVIDDPLRSCEDADSQTVRDKIWEWYKADLSPRLRPRAKIVLIQTRWHEDDLAGRCLEEMARGVEEWHIVSLPAIAQPGDPLGRKAGEFLWTDDDYGYALFLQHEHETQTPRNWSALYQQEPAPEGGNFFKADWLRPYIERPALETLTVYGASDYAVTADGGDYTVHVVIGMDPENRIYLLDLWRQRTSSDVWISSWCDMVKKWKPLDWAEEQGQISSGIGPFRDAEAARRQAYVNVELFPTRGDKGVRAQSIRGRMAMGGLYVPAHAGWFADLRAELLSFPAGKHDDQVDALGLVGQLLDRMIPGCVPKSEKPEEVKSGYKPIEDLNNVADWRTY
jgi:predicted phage terminase large subunit-like protein